ncbi:DUF3343 domain-containing protein [Geobacter sp. FeAm09]|uniref:DUF3343 domain-containing protein n=1 Tax=Geobacter sp. FeAm09 TaxID=2597769 RepID=UPI0011EBE4DD|nr:DUF3343 domain-containing protein [Geobacter sp. FeAm09]QEM69038.1 DUF3343 domain-containing protein [Geobacter sp. FeAm09]
MEKRLMVQEGHLLAVFNSGHRVMKAEGVLKALGLPVLLIPAPRQLQTDCGLALRFGEEAREEIMQALEREDLLPAFVSRYTGGEFVTSWVNEAHEPPTM